MGASNGANGHGRPTYAEPIREQGPKTLDRVRERIDAAVASEGPSTHARAVVPAPIGAGPKPLADLLRELTGKPADKTLPEASTRPFAGSYWHEPNCDGWVASPRAQGLVECTGCAPAAVGGVEVEALATFEDATGSELRVEHDKRDGRHFIAVDFGAGEVEAVVQVPPRVALGVASVLCAAIGRGEGSSDASEGVKKPAAPVKQGIPTTADVEHDGDRGPRTSPARSRLDAACAALPDRLLPLAVWIVERLATLQQTARALTWADSEPVDRYGRFHTRSKLTPTPREHVALGALVMAVREIERAIDPYQGQEVDPRAKGGGA